MNRVFDAGRRNLRGFPHRRGGEPPDSFLDYIDLGVFPTGVGVNLEPTECQSIEGAVRFPHRRGGEPISADDLLAVSSVFPTGVGVNRYLAGIVLAVERFPHRRGGEPYPASS